ncbi:MAG: hypothetical protein LBI56_03325 [Puniceicoccales bacterium]|jgi:hypothetical protein|nr:hypothetical protein [Puniceicoccales bacterium]
MQLVLGVDRPSIASQQNDGDGNCLFHAISLQTDDVPLPATSSDGFLDETTRRQRTVRDRLVQLVRSGNAHIPLALLTNINEVNRSINIYVQEEYKKILNAIIPNDLKTKAEKVFSQLWNHGLFYELVNILPAAHMLKNIDDSGGGSKYNDGRIVGEAVISGKINIAGLRVSTLSPKSFVLLGHQNFNRFKNLYTSLKGEDQLGFKSLVQKLLDLIEVKGQSLSHAHNNLPKTINVYQ